MSGSDYWLAQWLDENEIASDWEIDHVLHTLPGQRALLTKIEEAEERLHGVGLVRPDEDLLTDSIVAGRRLDLSGSLSCPAYECLRKEIDTTFKNVWHYFDNIVVEGLSPRTVAESLQSKNDESRSLEVFTIKEQAKLLLYLREIGAEKFIVFANKTFHFCQEHWLEHAKKLGISDALNESKHQSLIDRIVKSSRFQILDHVGDTWHVEITGGIFDEPRSLVCVGEGEPTHEELACFILSNLATATISDVELARRLALPLLEPTTMTWLSSRSGRTASRKNAKKNSIPTLEDVAIALKLPVFDHLETRDLIKIREDERPDFEAFRSALRTAIRDRLSSATDSDSAVSIARSIDEEYLRPGLAEIERKARNNRQVLLKKTVVDLTIGSTAAGVAAITSVPLMIAGGAVALGSAVPLAPVIHKYIEDKRSIKMSDLYFLWHIGNRKKH